MVSSLFAMDWPTYNRDAGRTGYTEESLGENLQLLWTRESLHAPQPAWVGRDTRMPFDYAYQTVIADGTLFYGSSADCRVYALDAVTGAEQWSYCTDGPVRFAPTVWDGLVFVVSDDGHFYALDAEDGTLVWRRRGGPDGRMHLGNDRMISRWPARGGPVVRDGVLYVAAGIWPTDGVYVYALEPQTGEVVWCNGDSGGIEIDQPHGGAVAKSGISAQGYLAASEKRLFVPTGRAVPAGLKRDDGSLDFFRLAENQRRGGSHFVLDKRSLLNHGQALSDYTGRGSYEIPKGRYASHSLGFIQVADNTISSVSTWIRVTVSATTGAERIRYYKKTLWSISTTDSGASVIITGDTFVTGGSNRVTFRDLESGDLAGRITVDGVAHGLAVAEGRLYVSTDRGTIHCFAVDALEAPAVHQPSVDSAPYGENALYAQAAEEILALTGKTEGYGLDLGCGDGALAYELAQRSNLHIYAVDSDPENVALAREKLQAAGLYGLRVTVFQADPRNTGLPNSFADLTVSGRSIAGSAPSVSSQERLRLRRPYGGVTCMGAPGQMTLVARGALEGAGEWTHQYGDAANTTCSTDRIAKGPLGLLWFRDGDLLMPQRHGRGPAPLFHEGRMFVMGRDALRAVDAYNGRTLWELPFAGILDAYDQDHIMGTAGTNGNYCVMEGALFVHTKQICLRLNPATGETIAEYPPPNRPDGSPGLWGYIACVDGTLFGTLANDDHIVKWRWKEGDMTEQFTESGALFAMDIETGAVKWTYPAVDSIRHNAIAIGNGKVFLIDRPVSDDDRLSTLKRRGIEGQPLGTLLALDAATGVELWSEPGNIFGTLLEYSKAEDALLMSYQPSRYSLPSEQGSWMAVYRGASGDLIWANEAELDYINRPMVNGRTIYAEPIAVDLLTGQELPFKFERSYGCGTISGSSNMLLYRSATVGYRDLTVEGSQTENFGGCRPACWINTIAAGGLVLMPNAVTGCDCSYLMHATVALERDTGPPDPSMAVNAFTQH